MKENITHIISGPNHPNYFNRVAHLHSRRSNSMIFLLFGLLLLFMGQASAIVSQVPTITTRFVNPDYQCTNGSYCLDVEFLSNMPDVRIFGMNVRFFYPDNVLSLIGFSDFQGGYGAIAPDPPIIITSGPAG